MRTIPLGMLLACLLSIPINSPAQTAGNPDIAQLRAEVAAMRADYEKRIELLEKRLDEAEGEAQAARQTADSVASRQSAQEVAPVTAPGQSAGSENSRFNPAIGVIFQGQAWAYQHDPDGYFIPGFPLGGEAGLLPEGLALGETEINISANVDDKFMASLTVPVFIEDGEAGIDIEEAWIETLAMPAGLSLRMGRQFVDIGYLNQKHAHTWDFADQPLPYKAFLGGQYGDDSVLLRWLAPTDLYLQFSAEINRGANYPAGGAAHSGFGSYALHAVAGGDVGFSNSWLAGVSWLHADADSRASGSEDDPLYFTGRSELMMAEFVWKWAPNGNIRQQNFKFVAEYMWRNEDGVYSLPDGRNLPYDNNQQGWYLQAVLQPFPRWRVGVRWDHLSSDNPGAAFDDTTLMPLANNPQRYSVMADFSNSEFSRFRLQYTRDKAGLEGDNQVGLQYIFSIGAHGAHTF